MDIFGVYLDFPYVRTSLVRKSRTGAEIVELKTFSFSDEPNVKPLYMKNFKGRIATGLPTKKILIRPVEIKIAGGRYIEEAAAFQSEALSHFKPEEAITVSVMGKKEKDKAEGLLFTVPREGLKEHLEELARLEIDPDTVSTAPSGLSHFIRWKFPHIQDALIVDLGAHEITCVWLEKGRLKKSHAIPKGVEDLLMALHEDRKKILLKKEIEGSAKQIDLLLLKANLNPRLSAELTALRYELAKVSYSLSGGDRI